MFGVLKSLVIRGIMVPGVNANNLGLICGLG
ncbi:AcrZ family multidrug efflux pump-associated protein [Escherichia coli]|nr:AcrZ family multidrug efflux pump-associated protein [Escherichia coli]